jgi:hypothetical protein
MRLRHVRVGAMMLPGGAPGRVWLRFLRASDAPLDDVIAAMGHDAGCVSAVAVGILVLPIAMRMARAAPAHCSREGMA